MPFPAPLKDIPRHAPAREPEPDAASGLPGMSGPGGPVVCGHMGNSGSGLPGKQASLPSPPGGHTAMAFALNGEPPMAVGAGVSGNDFQERKDLAPNLCALYVDETCRGRGIARRMQDFIRRDRGAQGVCRRYRMMDLAWHSIKNAAGNSWAWLEATAMRGNAWTARKHTVENGLPRPPRRLPGRPWERRAAARHTTQSRPCSLP